MSTNLIWETKTFEEFTTEELYKILRARIEVFIIEQNCAYQDLDNTDQVAVHLWAEKDNEIVAYCRLFNSGIKYEEASIGRVITSQKYRGKSLGKKMMKYAVAIIENRFRTSKIRISAQDYLIPFYTDFGFIATDKKYLEDSLPHTEMYRV